jgi:hypothetical protein
MMFKHVTSEVLSSVTMVNTTFWDVTPCSLVDSYQRPNIDVECVSLLSRNQGTLSSNLSSKMLSWQVLRGTPQSPKVNAWGSKLLGYDRILQHPFQFNLSFDKPLTASLNKP